MKPSIFRPSLLLAAVLATAALAPAVLLAQPANAEGSAEDPGPHASALETGEAATVTNVTARSIEAWITDSTPWALTSIVGRPAWRWIFMAATLLLFLLMRRVLMSVIMKLLLRLTSKTKTDIDDELLGALDPPLGWFVVSLGVYVSLLWVEMGTALQSMVDRLYRVSVIIIVGWALLRSVSILIRILGRLAEKTETQVDDHLVPLVGRVLRFAIFGLIVVFVLQELGLNVTGLIAGIGVGGLALALAAQDTVANWFGALMIYTDRPFKVGDWIKTPALEGVVEEIGLRSTRVRTFSKTVVSVPNRHIADATIDNFSRMDMRRITFKFGVTYSTTPTMMRETLERMKDIIREHPGVDQKFWLVKFTEFEDSALTIFFYFFTNTTDWADYLSIREEINLQIMDAIETIGVEAAFPSTSVYLETHDPAEIAELDERARKLLQDRDKTLDAHIPHAAPADPDG